VGCGFKVLGCGLWVVGSGLWVQGSLLSLACKAASQIEKETLKKRIHIGSGGGFDAYSPPLEDSTLKPLRAGINPAPTPEAQPKK